MDEILPLLGAADLELPQAAALTKSTIRLGLSEQSISANLDWPPLNAVVSRSDHQDQQL